MCRVKCKYSIELILNSNELIGYRFGNLYLLDAKNFSVIRKLASVNSYKETILSHSKLFYKLFRLGIRASAKIDDETILLFVNKRLCEYSFATHSLSDGKTFLSGVRPLKISIIHSIDGFDDMVVFGGYLGNPNKKEVSVYCRTGIDSWKTIYTFPENLINHIHNIVPDVSNKCVWILTGDFDKASAIWKATYNFKKVEFVVGGEQKYRSCVAFPVNNGLLYATDTPFADNTIRFLIEESGEWTSKKICSINGSCIYGCRVNDKYIFSTAVESDGRGQTLKTLCFERKRGCGIKDDYCHLYVGGGDFVFEDIYYVKKDIWPFVFQFGTLQFPEGDNNTGNIFVNHMATKHYDTSTIIISVN